MRREPAAYLWDIREASLRIREFVVGYDFAKYTSSELVQSAVERQFEIIGEALSQLAKIAPAVVSQIPDYQQIIAFRNILIHGYAVLDQSVVWKVIQGDLAVLEKAVQDLLSAEPPPPSTRVP
jgi:uncharacterized protein with HEPN domain